MLDRIAHENGTFVKSRQAGACLPIRDAAVAVTQAVLSNP